MSAYGKYLRREEVERDHPEVIAEWDTWLENHSDLGHYDAYKVKDPAVLPYIDGQPQWVCDTYMPPHLLEKIGK